MRHRYLCPIRWGDIDMLGHVNNVRYVDYLQEARVDMLRAHRWAGESLGEDSDTDIAEGIVVVRHEVTYVAPLLFDLRPVIIECWVTELRTATFTMAYEIFHEDSAGARTVYLRATTKLAPYRFDTERPRRLSDIERETLTQYLEPAAERLPRPERFTVRRAAGADVPIHVRFSDVDVYRHVNNVVYFEYLQEARIRMFLDLGRDIERVGVVTAQTNVDYLEPITLRAQPYQCWQQISRVGTRSMTLDSEIADADRVLARSRVVLVFFDAETQRATEPPAELRDKLEQVSRAS